MRLSFVVLLAFATHQALASNPSIELMSPSQDWARGNRSKQVSVDTIEVEVTGQIDDLTKPILVSVELSSKPISARLITPTILGHRFSAQIELLYGPGAYLVSAYQTIDSTSTVGVGSVTLLETNPDAGVFARFPSPMIQSEDPAIKAVATQLAASAGGDRGLALAVHNYVAGLIAYDVTTDQERSAVETLNNQLAVCTGYANLTTALLRAIGIPAKRITGAAASGVNSESVLDGELLNAQNENHAWTEALVDGQWISIDTTWDAGFIQFDGPADATQPISFPIKGKFIRQVSKRYFDPDPALFEKTHRKIDEQ